MIANAAIERDDGAVFGMADVANQRFRHDRIANQQNHIIVDGQGHS
jgi:hypothetical protein